MPTESYRNSRTLLVYGIRVDEQYNFISCRLGDIQRNVHPMGMGIRYIIESIKIYFPVSTPEYTSFNKFANLFHVFYPHRKPKSPNTLQ